MGAAIALPEQEHKILKEKYNRLVDLYSSLNKENENLKKQISLLKASEKKTENPQSYTTELSEDTFHDFFASYIAIIRKALDTGAFITYTYASKNSKNYLKIEKSIFEQLIVDNTTIPLKNFREFCAAFMLIKSENNKYTFTNDRQTVYYINKSVLSCITTDPSASAIKENT